jgi:3-deoxy-D-manno-octulosonic-acid transferase
MGLAFDAAYAAVAVATAPWWARKHRSGWAERFGAGDALPTKAGGAMGEMGGRRPRLLIHAVSVGEVSLIRPLVDAMLPHAEVVISVTTDTGIARARELFAGRCAVVRYPLDASWAVRRFLDRIDPDAVALAELELWPQFLAECARRTIPVAIVNGRLSARSFSRYRLMKWALRKSFASLAWAGVQDQTYAQRFRAMGVPADRCDVVGSMKWDAAVVADRVEGATELARAMGIDLHKHIVVAGSTEPGEPELLHAAIGARAQLVCAPRKPEWFDSAAAALPGCVRRSGAGAGTASSGRFLLDTIGELRKAYALADVVVIGRSFGSLYGSDPMEPAALGKALVIGPRIEDFRSAVETLDAARAIVRTDAAGVGRIVADLLDHPDHRIALGNEARRCVLQNQGATARHAAQLARILEAVSGRVGGNTT